MAWSEWITPISPVQLGTTSTPLHRQQIARQTVTSSVAIPVTPADELAVWAQMQTAPWTTYPDGGRREETNILTQVAMGGYTDLNQTTTTIFTPDDQLGGQFTLDARRVVTTFFLGVDPNVDLLARYPWMLEEMAGLQYGVDYAEIPDGTGENWVEYESPTSQFLGWSVAFANTTLRRDRSNYLGLTQGATAYEWPPIPTVTVRVTATTTTGATTVATVDLAEPALTFNPAAPDRSASVPFTLPVPDLAVDTALTLTVEILPSTPNTVTIPAFYLDSSLTGTLSEAAFRLSCFGILSSPIATFRRPRYRYWVPELVGEDPPLRLAQRDDGLGMFGHARLPLNNHPSSIQTIPSARILGSTYL